MLPICGVRTLFASSEQIDTFGKFTLENEPLSSFAPFNAALFSFSILTLPRRVAKMNPSRIFVPNPALASCALQILSPEFNFKNKLNKWDHIFIAANHLARKYPQLNEYLP